ncbi:type IV secretory system conjugative DNA transfer family protein, partial [Coprococcus eutactus]|nr:type IV secretory system conjugative DNA transfer family protein [Coprococcus eutactus]
DARKKNAKQFRHGEDYGCAKWGTEKDFEPYTDPVKLNNIPLTATEWLIMTRPEPQTTKIFLFLSYFGCSGL